MKTAFREVLVSLRASALAFGIPELAAAMNKKPGTLYNKLSLSESTPHQLTALEMLDVIDRTQSAAPVQALCRLAGGVFVHTPSLLLLSDQALLEIVNSVYAEGGDVSRLMNKAFDDGHLSRTEYDGLALQIQTWVAAILQLRERLREIAYAH